MGYKIVVDSCCDLNETLREKMNVSQIPLTLYVGDSELRDDENLDIQELLERMRQAKTAPSTASPSPYEFLQEFEGEDRVFVVTLSSRLSSTYENAEMARKMALEKDEGKSIHIFDSLSASVGETLVSLKLFELIRQNYRDLDIVQKVNDYIKEMKTYFIIDSLDTLIKSGRVSKLLGALSSVLSIKPIMGGTDEGTIALVQKVRGSKRAFRRLVEIIAEQGIRFEEKVLGIAHCNCLERAEALKDEILKRCPFKDVVIVEMQGVSTVYANEGGIVVAF